MTIKKNWSKHEQLNRWISRHRSCDCDECGPIEMPIEIELTGIAIIAIMTQLSFCKRSALTYYIIFWIIWEFGIYIGGKNGFCSKNVNYKRRFLVVFVSIIVWFVSREMFCPI